MEKAKINRTQLIDLSNAAFQLGNFDCARKLLIAWLKEFPNDLWIRYRLAIVLYKSGKTNEAIRLSEIILKYDPEFFEVWALLSVLYPENSEDKKIALSRMKLIKSYQKGKEGSRNKNIFGFFNRGLTEKNLECIDDVDDFDIITAIHFSLNSDQQKDLESYFRLMKIYTRRWPNAIQFKLLLGDVMNKMGNVEEGTKLIHSTLENDLLGQVANRTWKENNVYKDLWIDSAALSIDVSKIQIPLKVGKKARLDHTINISWSDSDSKLSNRSDEFITAANAKDVFMEAPEKNDESLPNPIAIADESMIKQEESELSDREKISPQKEMKTLITSNGNLSSLIGFLKKIFTGRWEKQTETIDSIKEFIYKLDPDDADERFPVYVILSTVAGLTAKYGKNNKDFIDQEMRSAADAIENRNGWNAMVFYPDEFQANSKTVLDPQSIRNSIIKLDESLAQKGSMIGALLIVGGHDVVPFFKLSNPAMDDDLSICSDAPYGSPDSSRYYDQQWQVGRIPGDSSDDPGLLLSQLRSIQNYHIAKYEQEQSRSKRKSAKAPRGAKIKKGVKSFGYCCSVWQRPSVAIYRNLTDSSEMLVSPPTMATNFPSSRLEGIDFGYFNLHGIKGQPNWYGQKDSKDTSAIPMIPVALQIQNLQPVTKTPKVVFAENCYGAEILNRNESNAISLHMIGKGTHVFIGSTVIAYGAMSLPLTAADLLAHLFWKHLMTGISCGEAFRRAKKNLATETESNSGALDGEIQKTLISFIFLGDPLYAVDDNADITDRMQRAKTPRSYELIHERLDSKVAIDTDLAKKIYEEVKEMYKMEGMNDEFSSFTIQKQILSAKSQGDRQRYIESPNYVVVFTKDAKLGNMTDRLITRVTVSKDGKIKKVSFSR